MKNNNLHNANYYLNNLIIALKSVLYKRICHFFGNYFGTDFGLWNCFTMDQSGSTPEGRFQIFGGKI